MQLSCSYPITNKIYVVNELSDSVTVIDGINSLIVSITPSTEKNGAVKLQFHATNMGSSATPTVQGIYYQIDSMEAAWIPATRSGKEWTATVTSLTSGEHTIYAWVLEKQENGMPKGMIT